MIRRADLPEGRRLGRDAITEALEVRDGLRRTLADDAAQRAARRELVPGVAHRGVEAHPEAVRQYRVKERNTRAETKAESRRKRRKKLKAKQKLQTLI